MCASNPLDVFSRVIETKGRLMAEMEKSGPLKMFQLYDFQIIQRRKNDIRDTFD